MINDFSEWLVDFFLWIPRQIYSMLLDGLATVFESIPLPTGLATAQSTLDLLAPIGFFIALFRLDAGFTMLLSAHLIRFFIRRLPLIG